MVNKAIPFGNISQNTNCRPTKYLRLQVFSHLNADNCVNFSAAILILLLKIAIKEKLLKYKRIYYSLFSFLIFHCFIEVRWNPNFKYLGCNFP